MATPNTLSQQNPLVISDFILCPVNYGARTVPKVGIENETWTVIETLVLKQVVLALEQALAQKKVSLRNKTQVLKKWYNVIILFCIMITICWLQKKL